MWSVSPKKFQEQVQADHRQYIVTVALRVFNNLVLTTPVDTGRARANWLPTVGAPANYTVEATNPLGAVNLALSIFNANTVPNFPTLYIANNLDYIESLNNGSSKQAPANFVELALSAVSDVL